MIYIVMVYIVMVYIVMACVPVIQACRIPNSGLDSQHNNRTNSPARPQPWHTTPSQAHTSKGQHTTAQVRDLGHTCAMMLPAMHSPMLILVPSTLSAAAMSAVIWSLFAPLSNDAKSPSSLKCVEAPSTWTYTPIPSQSDAVVFCGIHSMHVCTRARASMHAREWRCAPAPSGGAHRRWGTPQCGDCCGDRHAMQ